MTWVLIGMLGTGLPVLNIPGYDSREACATASAIFEQSRMAEFERRGLIPGMQMRLYYTCVPGPMRVAK